MHNCGGFQRIYTHLSVQNEIAITSKWVNSGYILGGLNSTFR